jgi:hypothetical protein
MAGNGGYESPDTLVGQSAGQAVSGALNFQAGYADSLLSPAYSISFSA